MAQPGSFMENLCRQGPLLMILLVGMSLALVLSLVSAVVVDQDAATEAIILLNVVGTVPIISFAAYVLYRCRDIDPTE